MEVLGASAVAISLVFVFLGIGTWIFAGLMLVGVGSLYLAGGMSIDRIGSILSKIMWASSSTWELSAIPLYIWMGEILFRTDISQRMFRGLVPWVDAIPGRLLHTNVGGCTMFAAVCGSSVATTATVGKITIAALRERGYDSNLSIGSLAGAGSFGLMIPPSINMIIYCILVDESVARLFAAGIFPGLMMAGMYSFYIIAVCMVDPSRAPPSPQVSTFAHKLAALADLVPVIALIFIVLGSIYSGLATPSEAAVVGVAGAFLIAFVTRQMTLAIFWDSLINAVKTSSMIITIVVAAAFMSSAMAYLHVPQEVARFIEVLNLHPYLLILLVSIFYLILGMFLDGVSMLVLTLPVIFPVVVAKGFDPIWFGVYVVLMTELGQVTPPVGFNLFVLQGLTGKPIGVIARAAFPFFVLMCAAAAILVVFPQIALWFPNWVFTARPV